MGVPDTRRKSGRHRQQNMITEIDITKTKAWSEMEKLGFRKFRLPDECLTVCYGAVLRLNFKGKVQNVRIEPFRRHQYIPGKKRSILRVMWKINSSYQDPTHFVIKTQMVLSSKLLAAVYSELTVIKASLAASK